MTIRKIAAIAGVSKTTVSAILRGRPGYPTATRERIFQIAESLGYQVHGAAAALATGRFNLLGVMPSTASPFRLTVWDQAIIEGFVEAAAENGMQTVLMTEVRPPGVPKVLDRRCVDGTALMIQPHPEVMQRLLSQSVPCVAIELDPHEIPEMDLVYPDDRSGVEQAIRHLVALGHRRIAYVNAYSPRADQHHPSIETRQNAYLGVMSALGLSVVPGYRFCRAVEKQIDSLLDADELPTALMCYSDDTARRAIRALGEHGVRVPDDVSVVGIDDLHPPPGYPLSDLTSVFVPFEEMGARAAKLLCERIADPTRPVQEVKLAEHLVTRRSTAAVCTDSVRKRS